MDSLSTNVNNNSSRKKNIIKYSFYALLTSLLFYYVYYTSKTGIESVVFQPIKEHHWNFEEMTDYFVNDLHVWYSERNKEYPVILFCHGNWGNVSHRRYFIDMTKEFECSIVLFDYSGYGKSKGTPNTTKILENGEDVYNWMINTLKIPESKIVVMGESIGGSVASHIAHKFNPYRLILLSTFSCLTDVAHLGENTEYKWKLASTVFTFFIGNLPIAEKIKNIKCPVLILHSKGDNVIPFGNALKNYESIPHSDKELIEIAGDHCSPKITVEDITKIAKFIGIEKTPSKDFPERFSKIIEEIVEDLRKYMSV
jgi:pimeloyl-ACP methyl ester carboxylesterase